MSLADHFLHTCTIQRPTVVGKDRYQADRVTWADVAVEAPCRFVEKSQRVFSTDLAQFVVTTTYTLLLAAGADVLEGDRIADVRLEDGSVQAGPFEVASALRRRARALHHLSLGLEIVT